MIESNKDICLYCGACVGICPRNCIYLDETKIVFDQSLCTKCNLCVRGCPVGAITLE